MKGSWVRPVRTGLQVLVALIPLVPVLVPAIGLSATVGAGAILVSVAAGLSRVMAVPQVEALLKKLGVDSDRAA